MGSTHAIVGYAVLVPAVFALLAGLWYAVRHLDAPAHGRLGDPLDRDLVRRWNLHAH